jgi:hypothetical protein
MKRKQDLKSRIMRLIKTKSSCSDSRGKEKMCRELLSCPDVYLLPKDVILTLRRYCLTFKHNVRLHNMLISLAFSDEYLYAVLRLDRGITQEYDDYFSRVCNMANKCYERVEQLEDELRIWMKGGLR